MDLINRKFYIYNGKCCYIYTKIISFEKSGNEEFVKQLTQWTFQEKSVLKVVGHSHRKQNDTQQLDWYRVKDDIVSYI